MHICKWVLYACRKYVCETMIATVSSLTFLFYREKCINFFSFSVFPYDFVNTVYLY